MSGQIRQVRWDLLDLPLPTSVTIPRWQANTGQFADGSNTIRAAFIRLAAYAKLGVGSSLSNHANPAFTAPDDILGQLRPAQKTVGAYEANNVTIPTNPPPSIDPNDGEIVSLIFLLFL